MSVNLKNVYSHYKSFFQELDNSPHIPTLISAHQIRYFDSHNNPEYIFEKINEGLIVSYDINKCRSYLKKLFPNIVEIQDYAFNPFKPTRKRNPNDFVGIILNSDFQSYTSIIQKIEPLIGWFVSVIKITLQNRRPYFFMKFEIEDGRTEFHFIDPYGKDYTLLDDFIQEHSDIIQMDLIVEAKYSKRYYPEEGEKLYHISNAKVKDKILRKGLIPKTSGNFPERIYLGKCLEDIERMIGGKIDDEGAVFEITVVDDSEIFYEDFRHEDSFFTYDNIPPSQIKYIGTLR